MLDSTMIQIELIDKQGHTVLKRLKLKGKVEDDLFSIDRNLKLIPFWPVFYLHRERKTLIGNSPDGELIVTTGYTGGAVILLFAADRNYISTYQFEKIAKL